jgi:uncharacterized protein (TIGR03437 family)
MTWKFTLCFLTTALASQAQTLTTLATFDGTNGAKPNSLVQGTDGNFYGTDGSMIFRVTPQGALTTLYSFSIFLPPSSLIQASDGDFYGTTGFGGPDGWGTIFKITPSGTVTTVYTFQRLGGNYGIEPAGGLIQAADGNFYGTTNQGGQEDEFGTVFKLTPQGTSTTLHNFLITDGANPLAALIQGTDGNFYGTTSQGGAGGCPMTQASYAGCGTIFKITPGGVLTTLYSFGVGFTASTSPTPADGANPSAPLVQGSDGNFYGTTPTGGIADCEGGGCGTIFKITPGGTLTTLYTFGATPTDGVSPAAGLIQASDGNFYGTTTSGGMGGCLNAFNDMMVGCGTIFRITPSGSYTTLYRFGADFDSSNQTSSDGATPLGPLIQSSDGNFYGTALAGGAYTYGTVFKFSLASPDTPAIASTGGVLNGASFQPGIAPDSWITISGTNLSSTTDTWNNAIVNGALPTTLDGVSVMVGDQAAYIEYISATQINALAPSVPAGSVPVTVTNASGTSQAVMAQLSAEQPAFFQWGTYAVATRQDFSLAVKNGTFAGTTTVPAKPGDVIILWGTGFGPTSPSAPAGAETPSTTTYNTATAVSVTVGGKPATVYGAALAPGYAGLYQIAIQIPASLTNGDYAVVATINGAQSPSTTLITVQN